MDENVVDYVSIFLKEEPLAVIFLVVASLLLFGFSVARSHKLQPWYRNIFHALACSFIFFGLAFGGNAFLKSNIDSFDSIYQSFTHQDSLSWTQWARVSHGWPGWIIQKELVVNHFIEVQELTTLPANGTSSSLLYRTITSRQQIPQNSIVGFTGKVDLTLESDKNPYGFNGFQASASFQYKVVNQSEQTVETEFQFPLDTTHIVYQNVSITVDGFDVNPSASPDGLLWGMEMSPHQETTVLISYDAKGMDGYMYSVPQAREIRDFALTITSNSSKIFSSFTPSGDSIKYETLESPNGLYRSNAMVDEAVAAPSMAVFYVQNSSPYAPQDVTLHILRFMPRALIFLVVVFIFTLLISHTDFRLRDLAYFQALAWLGPLLFMIVSPMFNYQPWALFSISLAVATLQHFFLKTLKMHNFPLFVTLAWSVILVGIYPLSGRDIETFPINRYDNFVLIGILLYVFSYALYQRIYGQFQFPKLTKQEQTIWLVTIIAKVISIPIILLLGALLVTGVVQTGLKNLTREDYAAFTFAGYFLAMFLLSWKDERASGVGIFAGCGVTLLYTLLVDGVASLLKDIVLISFIEGIAVLCGSLFIYTWKLKHTAV